ncbi:MAG: dynamin family protein [Desulfovibrio sp.]|nr:dynamin family protein [Desulfovibrio sp.]
MEQNPFEKIKIALAGAEKLAEKHYDDTGKALEAIASLYAALGAESAEKARELAQSRDELLNGLRRPVIRIAAIGTTSSAKSSLLNFLCGQELLPTDVQEKSAGVTRIRDAAKPGLFIEPTAGAEWPSGEIPVDSAVGIREKLDEVMETYRKAAANNPDIEAPEFLVEYPLQARDLLEAPEEFGLELLDLPGLKYTGDERNLRVMAECRDSLCLVTFGAHETDPVKQEALLDAAMEQIALIDAPLERMFFVATKTDEFLLKTPDGWPRNEKKYLEERLEAIKERIGEKYGAEAAAGVKLSRISPLPALLSLKLFDADASESRKAWKRIDAGFRGLVTGGRDGDPYEGVDLDLMGKFATWSDGEKTEVFNQLCETAGSEAFLGNLKSRLTDNLAAILLPPPYARYAGVADETGEWLKRSIDAVRLRIRGDARQYIEKLEETAKEQGVIQTKAANTLELFISSWLTLVIRKAFYGDDDKAEWEMLWQKFPHFASPMLLATRNWDISIEKAFLKPVESAKAAIISGRPLPDSLPDKRALESVLRQLIKHGYTRRVCLEGMDGEAGDAATKALPRIFDDFIRVCEKIADKNYKLAAEQLLNKIHSCLERIQTDFIRYLNEENDKLPDGLRGVARITAQGLKEYTEYQLKPASGIRSRAKAWNKIENVMREVSNLDSNVLVNAWRRITGKATKIIRERITKVIVNIPAIKTVEVDFQVAFRELIPERLKIIEKAIMDKEAEFSSNIAAYRTSLYDSFRENLKRLTAEKMENAVAMEKKLDEAGERRKDAEADLLEIKKLYSEK